GSSARLILTPDAALEWIIWTSTAANLLRAPETTTAPVPWRARPPDSLARGRWLRGPACGRFCGIAAPHRARPDRPVDRYCPTPPRGRHSLWTRRTAASRRKEPWRRARGVPAGCALPPAPAARRRPNAR